MLPVCQLIFLWCIFFQSSTFKFSYFAQYVIIYVVLLALNFNWKYLHQWNIKEWLFTQVKLLYHCFCSFFSPSFPPLLYFGLNNDICHSIFLHLAIGFLCSDILWSYPRYPERQLGLTAGWHSLSFCHCPDAKRQEWHFKHLTGFASLLVLLRAFGWSCKPPVLPSV